MRRQATVTAKFSASYPPAARRRSVAALTLFCLLSVPALFGQQFELVADLATGTTQTDLIEDALSTSGVLINGYTLFQGCTEAFGCELWRTDGTALGTEMLADTDPGSRDGFDFGQFVVLDGYAYFVAEFPAQLWRSDGTPEGTEVFVDRIATFGRVSKANGALWFDGYHEDHGNEPWTSDGTVAGTYMVADLEPGPEDSSPFFFTGAGSLVYFSADTATHGRELWASDGTEAGTYLVADIQAGTSGSSPGQMHGVGSQLVFRASDGTTGSELWRTDGSGPGTVRLEIRPGPESSSPTVFGELPGGVLLLSADDGINGRELWRTNGTVVQQVVDLNPGASSGVSASADWLLSGTSMYFTATDGDGEELWRTDGTAAGTVQVADINPGALPSSPRNLLQIENLVYYSAKSPDRELWATHVLTGATALVADLDGGPESSLGDRSPGFPGPGNTLLFPANVDPFGWELWRTDGTAGGTQRLTDAVDPASSEPRNLTPWMGDLIFQPTEGDDIGALVSVDGGDLDTDIEAFPFPESPLASTLSVWQNDLYLAERSFSSSLSRLWKWNGFSETLIAEDSVASNMTLNATTAGVAFTKSGALSITDGSVVGDFSLLELVSPPAGTLTRITYLGDSVYYTMADELWRTDFVNDTSELLVDISSDPELAFRSLLVESDGTFYFTLTRTVGGQFEEVLVCATDNSVVGYSSVIAFDHSQGFAVNEVFEVGGQPLLFTTFSGSAGWQLHSLAGPSNPATWIAEGLELATSTLAHANWLTFETEKGLWRTDGSAVGTMLLPAPEEFEVDALFGDWALISGPQVGRGFEFAAINLVSGTLELLPEIQPGPAGTIVEELIVADDILWVSAYRLDVGVELFRLDLEPWLVEPKLTLFADGFETGDTTTWSSTSP